MNEYTINREFEHLWIFKAIWKNYIVYLQKLLDKIIKIKILTKKGNENINKERK